MKIGCVKEIKNREYRVGLIPDNAKSYVNAGHEVWIEKGAGLGSGFTDAEYEKAGAKLVDTAKEEFLSCYTLDINRQKGVDAIQPNRGNAKNKNIFMDTYVMSKELFLDLVNKAHKMSAMYSLVDIVDEACHELDVRAVPHRGYFASITDFQSYYNANMSLIDRKTADTLFVDDWPIYTRTNDSCPTQYFDGSSIKSSVVSNGCIIEGTIENSVIGRGCVIKEGAVIKNCVISSDAVIGKGVHAENLVVDKHARLVRGKRVIASPDKPGYIKRGDAL